MSNVSELDRFRKAATVLSDNTPSPFHSGSGGGTSDGMEQIWKKLEEHDGRLDRIERGVSHLPTQQHLVWGAGVFFLALAGLLYSVGSFMSGTMSTALSAIQTVVSAKPQELAPPPQPTVIVVPQGHVRPITPTK